MIPKIKTSSRVYKVVLLLSLCMAISCGLFAIISLRDYVLNQSLDSARLAGTFAIASFLYYLVLQKYGFSNFNKRYKQEREAEKKSSAL